MDNDTKFNFPNNYWGIYIAEQLIWSEPLNDSLSIIIMFILLAIVVSNVVLITFILHKVIYK